MKLDKELKDLRKKLEKAWCRETSYYKDQWTPENPSCGQCMITTRYLVEHFGARAAFAKAVLPDGTEAQGGHFFAEIEGKVVDLTADQFPGGTEIIKSRNVSLGYLKRGEDGRRRYDMLTRRLNDATLMP